MLTNEDLQAIADLIDKKLDKKLDEKLQPVENRLSSIENKVSSVENKVSSVENKLLSIELTLENETNRNIKIIAEWHLDISRKLDNALKVENEKEMMLLRMNIVENEIRLLKEKLSQIA